MSLDDLVRVLVARRALGDWSAREREIVTVARIGPGDAPVERAIRRVELAARVHVDSPTGRGSADLAVDAASPGAPLVARIDEAIARAQVCVDRAGVAIVVAGRAGAGRDRRSRRRRRRRGAGAARTDRVVGARGRRRPDRD